MIHNGLLWAPAIFWGMSMIANVLNWLFNMQAGRILTREEFATLTAFLSFQYIFNIPASALTAVVSRFTAYYREKGEQEKHFYFFRQYWWLAWALGLTFLLLFLSFQGFIMSFFGFESQVLMAVFALLFVPLFLVSFEKGALFGQMAFVWAGVLIVIEAGIKFVFLFISSNLSIPAVTAAVTALPVSVFAAWFISILVVRSLHFFSAKVSPTESKKFKGTYQLLNSSIFAGLGAILIFNLDVLLVKHFFSASEAGIYSTLSLLGKTLYFGSGSLISILLLLTARTQTDNGQVLSGERFGKTAFYILLGLVALVGTSIWLSYFLIPELIITVLLTAKGLVVLPYLTTYLLGMLFLVLASCFTTYSFIKKNYLPIRLYLIAVIAEAVLISLYHQSLSQVVNIVTLTLLTLFAAVVVIVLFGITTQTALNNISSLFKLFIGDSRFNFSKDRKIRVLIFNWRDIKHVYAGGSEVYIHEISRRLVKNNCEVTLFTSNDGRCLSTEKLDGVQIVRRGGFITVYFWAALYYIFKIHGKFDIIVDSENGIPFFTPLFVKKPVILLVHHVHQDIFFKSLVPPFSWMANLLETYLMPWVYRKSHVAAVSASTAEDLLKEIGLNTAAIISNGVDLKKYRLTKKSSLPLISYIGRLKKYKSIEVLLLAFKEIIAEKPRVRLVIAGEGDHRFVLEKKAIEMGINRSVKFLGKVSEEEKVKLLGESWVMVQPSFMEGWGITCLEANACGTPVVASRISGFKDSVLEGVSGYLFEYGDHQELARRLRELINDEGRKKQLGRTARIWSKQHSWVKQSNKFVILIKQLLESNSSRLSSMKRIRHSGQTIVTNNGMIV